MHVLVVDDDEGVRRLIELVLTDAGYTVVSCATAEDALYRTQDIAAADVIVTDIRLPGMSGVDFLTRVAAARPDACVLVMTGFTLDPRLKSSVRGLRLHVLEKPFTPEKLLATVARICG